MTGSPHAGRAAFARVPSLALVALGALLLLLPQTAAARSRHSWAHHTWTHRVHRAPDDGSLTDPSKDAALIMDGENGRVLYARNANEARHPASLTKMMTLYLLFDALKRGQVNFNTPIYISQHAADQYPTKLGLPPGNTIPADIAIRAIVVRSANDIAVAIAEALGGSESHFAELMTEKARELGMRSTFFHNASGLPDDRQITTAADLGILARHLAYDFPQYFHYFALPGFNYRGRVYVTHDNLIGRYAGADGIKTGYTGASGFNLVSSVVRNGAHIIGVVMGGRSAYRRDTEMVRLLDATFAQIDTHPQMVARAEVPWQSMAQSSTPIIAGFQFGTAGLNTPPAGNQQLASLPPGRGEMDEETAESEREDGDNTNVIAPAPPPKPQFAAPPAVPPKPQFTPPPARSQVAAPPPQKAQPALVAYSRPIPNVRPIARDSVAAKIILASYRPAPEVTPIPRGSMIADVETSANIRASVGTTAPKLARAAATPLNMHGWTIQIGAFADMMTARTQLATYAERSMDVLGQAERIIVPFQGVDGKTLYRARFGPFVEQEARAVCATLTQRGQTCFAATR
ncbi:MAG TPA: SPOR domain-containing protein [Rhizomicrobium sp.]